MKLTVKRLLGVTFFLALLINGFINVFAIQELDERAFKLNVQVPTVQSRTVNFEERKKVLQRAYDAVKDRKQQFQNCYEEFDRIALTGSQFENLDLSRVSAAPIPTLSPETPPDRSYAFRERFRLWLPESKQYQLRVEFRVPIDLELQLVNEFKPESELFDFSGDNIIPVPSGESIILTEWTGDLKSEKNFRMEINGDTVFEAHSPVPLELAHHFGWGQSDKTDIRVHPTCISGISYRIAGATEADREAMFIRLISLDKEPASE